MSKPHSKVTLADLQAKTVITHWPKSLIKPHENTSIFRIQNEELGGCDKRLKFRVNLTHFLAGAEHHGENEIVCHPSLVADAIVKDIVDYCGGPVNPENFRFGATPDCKTIIGEDYRLVASLAYQRLKAIYEDYNTNT